MWFCLMGKPFIGVRSFHNPTDGNPITIAKATDGGWIQKGNFISDIPDYGIALLDDGKTVQLQTHRHSWQYIVSQDGTTITEHCTAENCGLPEGNGGSVIIKAPADNLIYDGKGKAAVLENTLISGIPRMALLLPERPPMRAPIPPLLPWAERRQKCSTPLRSPGLSLAAE